MRNTGSLRGAGFDALDWSSVAYISPLYTFAFHIDGNTISPSSEYDLHFGFTSRTISIIFNTKHNQFFYISNSWRVYYHGVWNFAGGW